MSNTFQIGLRRGERIYINGAVIEVDRKVRLELLNDATFLLGAHVMQLEQATTPLRQLYFLIQGMLMEPAVSTTLLPAIEHAVGALAKATADPDRLHDLIAVPQLVAIGKVFDALKSVRAMIARQERDFVRADDNKQVA